jgi:hypothetical protein
MSRKRPFVEGRESQDTADGYEEEKLHIDVDKSFRSRQVLVPRSMAGSNCLKLISWNVNGFRSIATTNKGKLLALVNKHRPDVLILQVGSRFCWTSQPVRVSFTTE